MNHNLNKSGQRLALILLTTSSFSAFATGQSTLHPSILPNDSKPIAIDKIRTLAEQKQQIIKEAAESVTETQEALAVIEKNNPKRALAILQDVSSKLDIVLAKYPAMTLVLADIDTEIIEFEGNADEAQKAIATADDFLDDGKVQEARQILDELISEVRVTASGIPLKTYPAAIKEAISYLSNGKSSQAANTLYVVLNSLTQTTEIVPLPVLNAEILLTEASEVEHKQDLSKEASRTEVLKLADAAGDQLKLAQLLGYGDKDDYKLLYTAINKIEGVIHSEKSAATWTAIKQHLDNLKNKLTQLK